MGLTRVKVGPIAAGTAALLVSMVLGCAASGGGSSNKGPGLEELLDQERYVEAEALLKSGNWKNTLPALKRINDTKTCATALKPCGRETLDKQEIQACMASIKSECESHYTTRSQQQAAADLYNKLNETQAKDDTSFSSECSSGMKWGYWLYKYSKWKTIVGRDFSEKFTERADCEEAFLTDKRGKESGCELVYVGEDRVKPIYEISAMAVTDAETESFDLRFGSEEKCRQAVTSGFTYHKRDYTAQLSAPPFKKYEFGPAGSKGQQRIVGTCKKVDVVICKKFSTPPNIGEIL